MLVNLRVIRIVTSGESGAVLPVVVIGRGGSSVSLCYIMKGISQACVTGTIEHSEFRAPFYRKNGH